MKETKEFYTFQGRLVNGIQQDAKDGLNPIKDFAAYIPALLAGQPGFQGLAAYPDEQAAANVGDKEALLDTLTSEIRGGSAEDNYDLAHGLHGIQMILAYAFRKGKERGEAETIAKLEAKGFDVSSL
jgi:hypothetical protein